MAGREVVHRTQRSPHSTFPRGYAEELEGAMQHVFGSTLVCKTLDIAKAVTFHKRVKLRSVTLEGDAVDPAGTMSGGSRGRQAPVLFQLAAVSDISK